MFPAWRLKIREAQLAVREGRWDEASALLSRESVRHFLPAKRLSREVASHFVRRAAERIEGGDSVAGWHDIQQATQLGGCDDQIAHFRQQQGEAGLQQTRQLIKLGETNLAAKKIAQLEQLHLGGDERRHWKRISQLISEAQKLAKRGEFSPASELLQRAAGLVPVADESFVQELASRQEQLTNSANRLQELDTSLHGKIVEEDWNSVLTLAHELLELAPDYDPALAARKRAWQAVGVDERIRNSSHQVVAGRVAGNTPLNGHCSTLPWNRNAVAETMNSRDKPGPRLVAWIDEVGGYLICLANEVVIGQPVIGEAVDIPLRADLSRRHATIRRDGENYVLTPIHTTRVDGQPLSGPVLLRNQALVELGSSLRLRFTKPHSLSATAVLQVESHHKPDPAVDGILLMSESCVLGPQPHSHIRCPAWSRDLVLFRQGEGLGFRYSEPLEVNEEFGGTSGLITSNCRLVGDDFALSFETL